MVISNLKIADGVAKFAMTYYSHLNHKKVLMDFAIYDSDDINEEYERLIRQNHNKIFLLPPVKDIHRHICYCRKLFKKRQYDIVHDNTLINTIPLMREAFFANVPARILHSHATKLGETKHKEVRNRIFLPVLKKYVNEYSACTDAAGKCMFTNSAFMIIPNVIHGERFIFDEGKRHSIRKQYGINDREKVVITVGRMAPPKNPYFAVNVMNKVIEQHSDIVYWWIGDGPLKENVKKHISTLSGKDKIVLIGSQNSIEDFYMASDLFFLPSLFEGLGIVAVEAQATGLPCLISDTIPKDVDYTNNVERMSIKANVDLWSEEINNMLSKKNNKENRSNFYTALEKSIFCDRTAGSNLEHYYMAVLNKHNK